MSMKIAWVDKTSKDALQRLFGHSHCYKLKNGKQKILLGKKLTKQLDEVVFSVLQLT
ncbi:hypothetical protein P4629_26920 [Priestia aryabhattai]|uniref:hypothetical protein n=1 Tax=Priestia aryabhattai TaxID=412384 RepID=UPI002E22111C|nr:hypothetical protein [Priestia aryabhattai]